MRLQSLCLSKHPVRAGHPWRSRGREASCPFPCAPTSQRADIKAVGIQTYWHHGKTGLESRAPLFHPSLPSSASTVVEPPGGSGPGHSEQGWEQAQAGASSCPGGTASPLLHPRRERGWQRFVVVGPSEREGAGAGSPEASPDLSDLCPLGRGSLSSCSCCFLPGYVCCGRVPGHREDPVHL